MGHSEQVLGRNESFFCGLQIALDGVIQAGRMECLDRLMTGLWRSLNNSWPHTLGRT